MKTFSKLTNNDAEIVGRVKKNRNAFIFLETIRKQLALVESKRFCFQGSIVPELCQNFQVISGRFCFKDLWDTNVTFEFKPLFLSYIKPKPAINYNCALIAAAFLWTINTSLSISLTNLQAT